MVAELAELVVGVNEPPSWESWRPAGDFR